MARPLVLAKDYQQFCHARQEYKETLRDAIYVSTPQTLLGRSADAVVYSYGPAHENPHYDEYMMYLQSIGIRVQYI